MTTTLRVPSVAAQVPPAEAMAIIDALYRYGAGQDLHDPELFASAFAMNARVDLTGPALLLGVSLPVFDGRAVIVQALMAMTRGLDTTHTVTNPRITAYDGERATLFALVETQHLLKNDHRRHLLLKNIYDVRLSRRGDHWVIDDLRISNVWTTGDPAVLLPAATGGPRRSSTAGAPPLERYV